MIEPFVGGDSTGVTVVEQLAVFRILRALKMVREGGRKTNV